MPEPIVTLNEESLRGDLRELVRQTVEDTLNGLLEEEADDLVGAERVRAHRRPRGLPGGSLRPQARHDLGRGDPPHAQAEGHAVHHRNRRALPQARDLRRGGDDRDVPGGCLDAQDRGRERDPLGFQRVRVHRVQPQREGIRGGGGVAQPAPRARLPLRLRGRHLPEAQLGRLLRERGRYGGHRGERRRIQGGDRRRRGLHRVVRVLARFPLPGSGRGA